MFPGQRNSKRNQALESASIDFSRVVDGNFDEFGIPKSSGKSRNSSSTSGKKGGIFNRLRKSRNANAQDSDDDDIDGGFDVIPGVGADGFRRGSFVPMGGAYSNAATPNGAAMSDKMSMRSGNGPQGWNSEAGLPDNVPYSHRRSITGSMSNMSIHGPVGHPNGTGGVNGGISAGSMSTAPGIASETASLRQTNDEPPSAEISMDQISQLRDRHRYPAMNEDPSGKALSLASMSNYDTTPVIPMLGPVHNFQSGSAHNKTNTQTDKYRQRMIESRRALLSTESGVPISGNPNNRARVPSDGNGNRTMSMASNASTQFRGPGGPYQRTSTMTSQMSGLSQHPGQFGYDQMGHQGPMRPSYPNQIPPGQYAPGQYTPGQYQSGPYTPGQYPPGQFPGQYGHHGQYAPGPPVKYPSGQLPHGQYPPGQYPPGQYPSGQYPLGQHPPGQYPPGQFLPGQLPPGSHQQGNYGPNYSNQQHPPPGQFPPHNFNPDQQTPGQHPTEHNQSSSGQGPLAGQVKSESRMSDKENTGQEINLKREESESGLLAQTVTSKPLPSDPSDNGGTEFEAEDKLLTNEKNMTLKEPDFKGSYTDTQRLTSSNAAMSTGTPKVGPPMETPYMGGSTSDSPRGSATHVAENPSEAGTPSTFQTDVRPQVGLQQQVSESGDFDFGPSVSVFSPGGSNVEDISIQHKAPVTDTESMASNESVRVAGVSTVLGGKQQQDYEERLASLEDDVRVMSIELAESARRELGLPMGSDSTGANHAAALSKAQTQLAHERALRKAAEHATRQAGRDEISDLRKKLAESEYRHAEAIHLLSIRTDQYDKITQAHAKTLENLKKKSDENDALITRIQAMDSAQQMYRQDQQLRAQLKTVEEENSKLREELDKTSDKSPLGTRVKALEDQRAALQDSLRSMRERKDAEIQHLNSRIETLTQQRSSSSGSALRSSAGSGSISTSGSDSRGSRVGSYQASSTSSSPTKVQFGKDDGSLAMPRLRDASITRPTSPLYMGLEYNRP